MIRSSQIINYIFSSVHTFHCIAGFISASRKRAITGKDSEAWSKQLELCVGLQVSGLIRLVTKVTSSFPFIIQCTYELAKLKITSVSKRPKPFEGHQRNCKSSTQEAADNLPKCQGHGNEILRCQIRLRCGVYGDREARIRISNTHVFDNGD